MGHDVDIILQLLCRKTKQEQKNTLRRARGLRVERAVQNKSYQSLYSRESQFFFRMCIVCQLKNRFKKTRSLCDIEKLLKNQFVY